MITFNSLALLRFVRDMEDENTFGLWKGQCRACDTWTRVNDLVLCEECDAKIQHTLILAPTGSGKTLVAFLWGDEVLLYLWNAKALSDPSFGLDTAFDHQICQKILPKFHGSQAKLQEPLERLLLFCDDPQERQPQTGSDQVSSNRGRINELKKKSIDQLRSVGVLYPRAVYKVRRMLDALEKKDLRVLRRGR